MTSSATSRNLRSWTASRSRRPAPYRRGRRGPPAPAPRTGQTPKRRRRGRRPWARGHRASCSRPRCRLASPYIPSPSRPGASVVDPALSCRSPCGCKRCDVGSPRERLIFCLTPACLGEAGDGTRLHLLCKSVGERDPPKGTTQCEWVPTKQAPRREPRHWRERARHR